MEICVVIFKAETEVYTTKEGDTLLQRVICTTTANNSDDLTCLLLPKNKYEQFQMLLLLYNLPVPEGRTRITWEQSDQ